jgi:hypothetical protein
LGARAGTGWNAEDPERLGAGGIDNSRPMVALNTKMSIITKVLVFGKLTYFVRKILQREESKGIELTVRLRNGSRGA